MNIRKSWLTARFWLPAIVVGAFALSSPDANAAAGFNMIQPEEMNREYPNDRCSVAAEIPCSSTPYYLYGDNDPQNGGDMENACIYGNLNAPDGATLTNILLYFDLNGRENYSVAVWKMDQKRKNVDVINSGEFGSIKETIIQPVKLNLSGVVDTRKFLYVLQICGYGEFYAARLKYDTSD